MADPHPLQLPAAARRASASRAYRQRPRSTTGPPPSTQEAENYALRGGLRKQAGRPCWPCSSRPQDPCVSDDRAEKGLASVVLRSQIYVQLVSGEKSPKNPKDAQSTKSKSVYSTTFRALG